MGFIEQVARAFHDTYEQLAPHYGYTTRKESAVPWDQLPDNLRALMTRTVSYLVETEEIVPGKDGDFGWVLRGLRKGRFFARYGWNGVGQYIFLVKAEDVGMVKHEGHDYQYQSFICMKTANDTLVPWLASQTDMLALDWHEVYLYQ